MKVYLKKFKKTDECDVACAQPFPPAPDGIGDVVPMHSGDRFDNILGAGFVGNINYPTTKRRRYKVRKRKK